MECFDMCVAEYSAEEKNTRISTTTDDLHLSLQTVIIRHFFLVLVRSHLSSECIVGVATVDKVLARALPCVLCVCTLFSKVNQYSYLVTEVITT